MAEPLLPDAPPCPFCGSLRTELLSPFGGQLSVAQYWCRGCRTGFDFLKWAAPSPGGEGTGDPGVSAPSSA